ncbi:MAG: YbjQ family protein [Bacilli bacterium]
MIIVTSEDIVDKKIVKTLGIVSGSIVLSKNMFSDMGAGFKTMVGGELKSYTDMQQKARKEAAFRMVKQAEGLGANAVVATRYSTSAIMQGASEIIAFGTAVVIEE